MNNKIKLEFDSKPVTKCLCPSTCSYVCTHAQMDRQPENIMPIYTQGEVTVTKLSPFCGYNVTQCVALMGKDLLCYSNKTESSDLRKCPYDH